MPRAQQKPPLHIGVIGAGYTTDAETTFLALAHGQAEGLSIDPTTWAPRNMPFEFRLCRQPIGALPSLP